MPKQKTNKLKAADRKEADNLQRGLAIAKFGVETAIRLHFEAGEVLWAKLKELYPEITGTNARYERGIITYTTYTLEKGEI